MLIQTSWHVLETTKPLSAVFVIIHFDFLFCFHYLKINLTADGYSFTKTCPVVTVERGADGSDSEAFGGVEETPVVFPPKHGPLP